MSLSNAVKTVLLDPTVHNNQRTEFRIPDAAYASSMKLIDLGVFSSDQDGTKEFTYPTITGVMSCVKNIYLYSDTTLLDSIQNTTEYASIDALKTTNQGSQDVNRQTLLNGMGFWRADDEGGTNQPGAMTLGPESAAQNYYEVNSSQPVNNQVVIPATELDEQSGSFLISRLLEMLKTVSILPYIPNLRLVLEWDTAATQYFNGSGGTFSLGVIRPTLVLDELQGMDRSQAADLNIPYNSVIVERFQVEATATPANDTVPKRSSFKSQAFNAKFLKDVVLYNLPSGDLADANKWLIRRSRSVAQKDEVIQLVVNNSNHLPDRGCDQQSMKYHYFNDTQSQLNLPLIAGLTEVKDASGNILTDASAPLRGQFSVTGFKVGTVINDLRFEHQRTHGPFASSQDAFTLLAFGTVSKNLTIKNGQVRVSY